MTLIDFMMRMGMTTMRMMRTYENDDDEDDDHSPSSHWASRQGMELAMRGRPHKTPTKDDDEDYEEDNDEDHEQDDGDV